MPINTGAALAVSLIPAAVILVYNLMEKGAPGSEHTKNYVISDNKISESVSSLVVKNISIIPNITKILEAVNVLTTAEAKEFISNRISSLEYSNSATDHHVTEASSLTTTTAPLNYPKLAKCCKNMRVVANSLKGNCNGDYNSDDTGKFDIWTAPSHLMSDRQDAKFLLQTLPLTCTDGKQIGTLGISADHILPDGMLRYKNEYYHPHEYCINSVSEDSKDVEVQTCKINCEKTLCTQKCCPYGSIYSLGMKGHKGGCVEIDTSRNESIWTPTLYDQNGNKLSSENQISTHVKHLSPTAFKHLCPRNATTVIPAGEKVANYLSSVLRYSFKPLRFKMRLDGWLVNENHERNVAISKNMKTSLYCMDGVKNYGESGPFRNSEDQTVLFLCLGTSEEIERFQAGLITNTATPTLIIPQVTTTSTTPKSTTTPTTEKITTTPTTEKSTTTSTTEKSTTTSTTEKSTTTPTTEKSTTTSTTEKSTTTSTTPKSTTTPTTEKSTTTSTTEKSTTTSTTPKTITTPTTEKSTTTSTTEKSTTTSTTEKSTTTSTTEKSTTASSISSRPSSTVASVSPFLPTCCPLNTDSENEDEDGNYNNCNSYPKDTGTLSSHNVTSTEWIASPNFIFTNKITKFRLGVQPLRCQKWKKTFVHNLGNLLSPEEPVLMPEGILKMGNDYYGKGEFCVNGFFGNIVEVLVCKTQCPQTDTSSTICLPKCCKPNEIYSLGKNGTKRGCLSLKEGDTPFLPAIYKNMAEQLSDDELKDKTLHIIQKYPPKFQYNCYKNVTLVFPFSKDVISLMSPLAQINLEFRLRQDGKIIYKHPSIRNASGQLIESVFSTYDFCIDSVRNYGESSGPYKPSENQTILFVCAVSPPGTPTL